jgi:predicted phage terminase large subunit-like protein
MRLAEIVRAEDWPLMTPKEREEMLGLVIAEQALELSKSFRAFIPAAFARLEPETPFMPSWHVDAMAAHLQAVHDGQIRNLIINIPPRHMKSLTASVLFPAWEWASVAWLKFICTSYGLDLARRDSVKTRRLIESPWYQERWGRRVRLSSDQNVKDNFENTRGGYRIAAGISGALPGKGADRLIVDDAHKPDEVNSTLKREGVIEWWGNTLLSRVQDARTVAKVVIAQRLHERDLPGVLLEQGGWVHLNLPAEYESKPFVYVRALPAITTDPRTQDGDLLWPERFGEAELAPFKVYAYNYAAQFQQRPAPAGGGLFKRDWFRFYDLEPQEMAKSLETVIQTWDMTFKEAAKGDYVAGGVMGVRGADIYLLDVVHARMDFPTTCDALINLSARWPAAAMKCIEDKANGPAVIDQLRHKIGGLCPIEPRGSKQARASAASAYCQSGNVYLPRGAAWVEEFIAEMCSFPMGAHDDYVDMFTQGVDQLTNGQEFDMVAYAALVKADRMRGVAA